MTVSVQQSQINSTTGTEHTEYAPIGYTVIGVGWKVLSPDREDIIISQYPTNDATGWNFIADNIDETTVDVQIDVWLVCSNSI